MRKASQLCLASWLWTYLVATSVPALWPAHAAASGLDISQATRVSDTGQIYWVEQLAEGLNWPSSFAWLPDGDLLIAERTGNLRQLSKGKLLSQPIAGVPASYHEGATDGLREVIVDPDYRQTHAIYLYLSEGTFEQRYAAVYRVTYRNGVLETPTRIFRSKDGLSGFGTIVTRMALLGDKTLLLGVAEEYRPLAQQLNSHKGKILRINRDGSVPADNPFAAASGDTLPEIWSYGHRVPLGIYQDPRSGIIFGTEPGPRGGDELNVLKAGANYGWPDVSWGFEYSPRGSAASPFLFKAGVQNPIHIWMPSSTPSTITRYFGVTYKRWDGDYFIGHLTSKALVRVRMDAQGIRLEERMLEDLDERIRDVKVGPDNQLYVLTDRHNGRLLRLRPGQPPSNAAGRVALKLNERREPNGNYPRDSEDPILNLSADDLAAGRRAFLERCASCHRVGSSIAGGDIGPDLHGVYGRLMGHAPHFNYSPDMANAFFEWNYATLNRFLANPAGFVPGTNMAAPPVSDEELRRKLIGFLRQQSTSDSE